MNLFDLILRGGTLIDGTGKPAYVADLGIADGKIAAIGNLSECKAQEEQNVTGCLVTPGFIDIHRHADAAVFREGFGELELRQGLTTIVNGNCGLSIAPLSAERRAEVLTYLEPVTGSVPASLPTGSLADYLAAVPPLPIHTGMLAGSGTVRAGICGYDVLHPDEEAYRNIHLALEKALSDGALGLSLGLGYAPECFYTTEELIRALQPLAGTDIPLTVHMRQEGREVLQSIEEMLTVTRALRCPLHISHLKAMGKENMRLKIPAALDLMRRAREEGLDVSCDAYPYTAGSTQLTHILPPEFLEGGTAAIVKRLNDPDARKALRQRIADGSGFDNIAALAGWDGIYLTSMGLPAHRQYIGKNLVEIAAMRDEDPLDACCDLLSAENCGITMIDFMASEEDICEILRSDLSNLISDATYPTTGLPHPRVYGTFTRIFTRFVRELGALTVEEAVSKVTGAPARALRLKGKGTLAAGTDADLCVFRLEDLKENASYGDPCRESSGVKAVYVGGKPALRDDLPTGINNGTILKGAR